MEVSTKQPNREGLIVILGPRLTLASGIEWPIKAFEVGETKYTDVGLGDWTGFYDWLRSSEGVLLGVRYWPADANDALFENAGSVAYASIGTAGYLEIYFSQEGPSDPRRSNDQEFQYDAVFRSAEGEWAIVFDTAALTPSDLAQLGESDARWVTVNATTLAPPS